MNKVTLIGRMTRDPEIRHGTGEKATLIARYTLAVDRRGKDAGTDFINCISFAKTAEFLEKYGRKGLKIALAGRIQTGSYTNKDGNKVYTTDVIGEEIEFTEKREDAPHEEAQKPAGKKDEGFMNVPDGVDDEFPFR